MISVKRFCKLWTLFIVFGFNYSCAQQNVGLHKSYHFSVTPNYKLTADAADKSELTDGKSATLPSVFWRQKPVVGWQGHKYIQIVFDLGSVQTVSSISFSTAEGEGAGVFFPKGIYAYLSNDNSHFYYQGELTLRSKTPAGNNDDRGLFRLEGIRGKARYVVLCVYPEGKNSYLFCDEVAIFGGQGGNVLSGSALEKGQIKGFNDSLIGAKPALNIKIGENTANKVSNSSTFSSRALRPQLNQQQKQRLNTLNTKFNSPIVAQKTGSWQSVPVNYLPNSNLNEITFSEKKLYGGSFYGSFSLTNSKKDFMILSFELPNNSLNLYKIKSIGSKNGDFLLDPLIPLKGKDTLYPGDSQLYFLSISNITRSGQWPFSIVSSDKTIKGSVSIQLVNKQAQDYLNAVNWGYLNSAMLKDIKAQAVANMQSHHINTFVVHTAAIPNLNATDFNGFKNYVKFLPTNSRILLFMNYTIVGNKLGHNRIPFLSPKWKSAFLLWYNQIIKTMANMGFKESNIFLYPYDEVRKPEDIQEFKQMMDWLKTSKPNVNFFATITNRAAANALFNDLDIAQFFVELGFLNQFQNSHTQKWTYSILGTSRSLSPYSYYRLMAWKAYKDNVTGIGFWNYAGNKQKTYISSSFKNYPEDYTAIYNSVNGGGIINSRRWEAFKQGMEDFQVIKIFERRFGRSKTLEQVSKVLNNAKNTELAEQVVQNMLNQIIR
ncbi:MAG TPA: hypothetical protein VL053_03685 [Arachidicoccus sp.]|nr:hypothetical protein [Arachidicoccus sp.]